MRLACPHGATRRPTAGRSLCSFRLSKMCNLRLSVTPGTQGHDVVGTGPAPAHVGTLQACLFRFLRGRPTATRPRRPASSPGLTLRTPERGPTLIGGCMHSAKINTCNTDTRRPAHGRSCVPGVAVTEGMLARDALERKKAWAFPGRRFSACCRRRRSSGSFAGRFWAARGGSGSSSWTCGARCLAARRRGFRRICRRWTRSPGRRRAGLAARRWFGAARARRRRCRCSAR